MKTLLFVLLMIPVVVFAQSSGGEDVATEWAAKALQWGLQVIGAASVVSSFTPTKKDNAAVMILKVILDALAFNFGKAKNKDR